MSDQTCACPDCVCPTTGANAVKQDDKMFCCKACADGHVDGTGCCGGKCTCKG